MNRVSEQREARISLCLWEKSATDMLNEEIENFFKANQNVAKKITDEINKLI